VLSMLSELIFFQRRADREISDLSRDQKDCENFVLSNEIAISIESSPRERYSKRTLDRDSRRQLYCPRSLYSTFSDAPAYRVSASDKPRAFDRPAYCTGYTQ